MTEHLRPAFGGKDAFEELLTYSSQISALEQIAQNKSRLNIVGRQEVLNKVALAKKAYSDLVTTAMRLDNEISKHKFSQKPTPSRNGIPPKALAHQIKRRTIPPKMMKITLMQAQIAPKIRALENAIKIVENP